MKKFLLTAIFTCLMTTVGFSQNLITNGNFETWTDTGTMPDSWVRGSGAWGTQYYFLTDANQGKILRLADLTSSSVSARRFNTTVDFSILTEGTYRVTFKVKGNVGLRGVILVKGTGTPSTAAQSATNHFTSITDYPSGTNVADWTTLQYDITVPSTATFGTDYKLHFSWSSSVTTNKPICDFYIDDITLEKTPSVPTALVSKAVSTPSIFSVNGKIHFNTLENCQYTVFNLNGIKITKGVANNETSIALPKGVYIVKAGIESVKIVL